MKTAFGLPNFHRFRVHQPGRNAGKMVKVREAISACLEVRAERGLPLTMETQQAGSTGRRPVALCGNARLDVNPLDFAGPADYQMPPKMFCKPDSALIIVGHGSTVNPDSSAPTYDHAEEIARRGVFGEVTVRFWKEEPSLRQVLHSVDCG